MRSSRYASAIMLAAVAVIPAISGCATPVVRAPEKPAVPQAWSTPTSAPDQAVSKADIWWHELADDQLNQLIEIALNNSPDIEIAAARVQQARALVREADANRMPQLDAGLGAARNRVPQSVWRDNQGARLTIPPYQQSGFAARLDARFEVDVWGRLALGQRAAAADLAASQDDLRAVRQWLAREVVLAYADLRLAGDRAFLSQQVREILDELLDAERQRLSAGLVSRGQVRELERLVADQVDVHTLLDQERASAWNRLTHLLGKWTSQLQMPAHAGYFSALGISGAVTPDLPAQAIERRADVSASWHRVLAAGDHAERVRLERYPALTLTGNAGFISPALRGWLSTDALAWAAQSLIQTRVFDGGRLEARGEQARAIAGESMARYRKTVLAALAEVETALSLAQTARERVLLAQAEVVRRRADALQLADLHAAGLAARPALLEREVERLGAEDMLSLRRHELLVAWSHAQSALGR